MVTIQITAKSAVPQLVVTSEFAAPRELLFRTYTDPDLLAQWLGPRGLTVTVDHLDPAMAAPGAAERTATTIWPGRRWQMTGISTASDHSRPRKVSVSNPTSPQR